MGGGGVAGPGATTGGAAAVVLPPNFAWTFWPTVAMTFTVSVEDLSVCEPESTSMGSAKGAVPTI